MKIYFFRKVLNRQFTYFRAEHLCVRRCSKEEEARRVTNRNCRPTFTVAGWYIWKLTGVIALHTLFSRKKISGTEREKWDIFLLLYYTYSLVGCGGYSFQMVIYLCTLIFSAEKGFQGEYLLIPMAKNLFFQIVTFETNYSTCIIGFLFQRKVTGHKEKTLFFSNDSPPQRNRHSAEPKKKQRR